MEALQSSVSVPVPADLPGLHGLYDLPVLPHGLLAPHHHLLLHPHLTAGNTRSELVIIVQYNKTGEFFISEVIDMEIFSSRL